MPTHAQIRANRENSKKSTGPQTPEGKAASSANACKHGIYSTAILLPHEDPDAYQSLADDFFRDLAPEGVLERTLVQRLADTQWRMNRLDAIEARLYADYFDRYAAREDAPDVGAFKYHHSDGYLTELSRQYARTERIFRRAMVDLLALQAQRKAAQPAESKPVRPKLASFPRPLAALPPRPSTPLPAVPESPPIDPLQGIPMV